jgi:hypothetical protein
VDYSTAANKSLASRSTDFGISSPPILKTPQELIHIEHTITLRQYKYWVLMLRAYRNSLDAGAPKSDEGLYEIPIGEIAERLGYRPTNAELRTDLDSLRRAPIIYNALRKDGTPSVRGAGFISEWQVSDGTVGFLLPELLARSVQELGEKDSIFHLLNWSVFASFSGKHEANLYKLCKDYVGATRTPQMSVEEFRRYMGVEQGEYAEFKALNRYVVTEPIKTINDSEVSDISVEVTYRRERRRVVSMQFRVLRKKSAQVVSENPVFATTKIPITAELQSEALTLLGPNEIQLSIEAANEYIDKATREGKVIKNIGAVYRTAFRSNWGQSTKSNKNEVAKLRAETINQEVERRHRRDEAAQDAGRDNAANSVRETIEWQSFLSLDQTNQQAIFNTVCSGRRYLLALHKEHGFDSALLRKTILASEAFRKGIAHSLSEPEIKV